MSSIVGNFAVSGMQSDRSLGSSGLNGRETGADGPVWPGRPRTGRVRRGWASGRLGMAVAKGNSTLLKAVNGALKTVQGNGTYGGANLTVANGFTNDGAIELTEDAMKN